MAKISEKELFRTDPAEFARQMVKEGCDSHLMLETCLRIMTDNEIKQMLARCVLLPRKGEYFVIKS